MLMKEFLVIYPPPTSLLKKLQPKFGKTAKEETVLI